MKKYLIIIFILICSNAYANRIMQAGGELNSTTDGIEGVIGTGQTIVTSPTQGSRYAWKLTSNSSPGLSAYERFQFDAAGGNKSYYLKFDFQMDTLPGNCYLVQYAATTTKRFYLEFVSGVLKIVNATGSALGTGVTLNTNTWYTIETYFNTNPAVGELSLRVNGIDIDTAQQVTSGSHGTDNVYLGQFQPVDITFYFDNIIINDDQGSSENSWVGNQRLVYMRPNATMTESPNTDSAASYFQKQAGGAASGTSSNYTDVDEVTPDDDTTYIRKNSNNAFRDWYVIEPIATVGYPSAKDKVNLVAVGGRIGANGTSTRQFKYLYETASGGTGLTRSGAFNANANAWFMYDVNDTPSRPNFVNYLSGVVGSDLDNYQVGWETTSANANLVKGSTFWLEVSYTPYLPRLLSSTGVGI